jgi:hypothetical protein
LKLNEHLVSMGDLRQYLVEHPAFIWLLGFPLIPSLRHACGFDPQASLPTERHLTKLLRNLPNQSMQYSFQDSVRLLLGYFASQGVQAGACISLDTKHILAWVKENNPKEYVPDRFDKQRQPKGDCDCKLGCKERTNQHPKTPNCEPVAAAAVSVGTFYWGYGSGIVATRIPGLGEVVLAEFTQPFNAGETTYFYPLLTQVERRLGRRPQYGALDAAFDAFYVYDYFHEANGFAAVPLAQRGKTALRFDAEGRPLCQAGLAMTSKETFVNRSGLVPQRQARYGCPLLYPAVTGATCPVQHDKWGTGGCGLTIGLSPGVRVRHQLDREGAAFKRLYAQRTATERIFSQAKALGMEQPKLRNQASIANLNTLIYVLINLRSLQRLQALAQRAN